MQSRQPNEDPRLRQILDGVRTEFHVAPHEENTTPPPETHAGLVFEREEESEPKRGRGTPDTDFSFIEHLSSQEIYQMPTGDSGTTWSTYVPRFSDTASALATENAPLTQSPVSPSEQETTPPPLTAPFVSETHTSPQTHTVTETRATTQTPPETPKAKGPRVILPIDHAEVRASDDRIPPAPIPSPEADTTHIPRSTVEVSPNLSTSPIAEEEHTESSHQVTVVEIGQSAEVNEDVFVLPKRMQSHGLTDHSDERTEEDELREIMQTISPLSTPTVSVAQTQQSPVSSPEEVLTTVEEPLLEEETVVAEDTAQTEPAVQEPLTVEIPAPFIPTPAESSEDPNVLLARMHPDYAMPKPSEPVAEGRFSAEFTSYAEQPHIKDTFLDKILSVKVRLTCASILTFALIVLAFLPVFGVNLVEKFSLHSIPGVLAIVDMQGVLCLLVLAFPELIRAWRDIFKGRVRSEFFIFTNFAFILAYTVFVVILKPVSYPLFGSFFGILATVSIWSSLYMNKAQFMSFRLLSVPEEKNVSLATSTRTLPHENFALDGLIDEYKSKCARTFRATFIDGFFDKNKKTSENSIKILTFVCISIVCSLIVGIIAFILKDMKNALYSFMSVLCFSSPIFYILSHKLSYFEAEKLALCEDGTVIGEGTFDEYSTVDVLTYQDTEIFGVEDVALRRFKLIGEQKDFTKPLRQMASLFGAVGGPLSILFHNALERHPEPSEDVTVEIDGIYGTVDGVMVYAGSEEFMHRHGMEIPADETAPGLDSTPTTKVLYSAENNRVHAKFYIRYSFSEEFTMLLPALREAGITPLVYTRDPNITNDLLKALTLGGGNIRVMKKFNLQGEDNPLYTRLDGGIVTMGDKGSMLNMLLLAKRYRKFTHRTQSLLLVATLTGTLLGSILSIFFTPSLPIWVYLLWHSAWLIATAIFTKTTFRIPKKSPKDN